LTGQLQQSVRDFYEMTSSLFRQLQLLRPGRAEVNDVNMSYEVEKLTGSDPTFERAQIELGRSIKSNSLAFWMKGAHVMCRAMPLFRLGAPQRPRETSFYVFNRVENGEFRWVSYQETQEQELFAPNDELSSIISFQ